MLWFFLALASALLSAAAAVAQKKILFRLPALEFSFLVSGVIALFSFGFIAVTDVTAVDQTTLIILVGKSIVGGGAFLLVMYALRQSQISAALPLLGLTPGVAAVMALPALGESLRMWEWGGVMLMMLGTYLLENPKAVRNGAVQRRWFERSHYSIYGAVFLFALSSVLDRLLLGKMNIDARIVLFYQNMIYCLLFAGILFLRKSFTRTLFTEGKKQIPLLLSIALLTVTYRYTQFEATALAPVAMVLAVKRTSIVFASFFGGKLFSDDRLPAKLAGAALIVAAGFLILRNVA
jgi:drug/metabolite transporter (DMT)-like permease